MALPATVRVKLSSEAAGSISLTPVVVRDMATRELVEEIVALSGKDAHRLSETLRRGTLVSGASRFRWAPWEIDAEDLKHLLATFPDPDPSRDFDPAKCVRLSIAGVRGRIDLTREAASRTGLFQRGSFWEFVLEECARSAVRYRDYSYRDKADIYAVAFSRDSAARLRSETNRIRYTTMRDQLAQAAWESAELLVLR